MEGKFDGEIIMPREKDSVNDYVKSMLDGCLKHGLTALCKEKPEEPIKWLAHWLLDNNPNQPRVLITIIGPQVQMPSRAHAHCRLCYLVVASIYHDISRSTATDSFFVCATTRCAVTYKSLDCAVRCNSQEKLCRKKHLRHTSREIAQVQC